MTIEPTPELVEAVGWLKEIEALGNHSDSPLAATILAALPEEVTNPLPTKAGYYEAHDPMYDDGGFVVKVEDGQLWWYDNGGGWRVLGNPERFHPYTRLVPEKPPVTAEELWDVFMADPRAPRESFEAVADYANGDRA